MLSGGRKQCELQLVLVIVSCAVLCCVVLCRWQRAEKFGLSPPMAVKELLTGPQGEQLNNNLWEGRV
jgi:hypothetical protein